MGGRREEQELRFWEVERVEWDPKMEDGLRRLDKNSKIDGDF